MSNTKGVVQSWSQTRYPENYKKRIFQIIFRNFQNTSGRLQSILLFLAFDLDSF